MRNRFKVALVLGALVLGLAGTAAAQDRRWSRDGRRDNDYSYRGNRTYKREDRRDRYDRNRYRGRYDHRRRYNDRYQQRYGWNNGRRVTRQPQYRTQRTYRLPNGRLVTILSNGRRIYH